VKSARDAFTNDSAFMVAYERALETEKGDEALIKDIFAAKMCGDKGKDLSDSFGAQAAPAFGLWPDFHKTWTVVRTKFIDDTLSATLGDGHCGIWQFLNLGAGLDTRVFRLPLASSFEAAFEVDMEEINNPKKGLFKALGMEPLCSKHSLVSTDLKKKGELEKELTCAGFDPKKKSIIVAEGLIMYLGEAQQMFLEEVSSLAAPGSVFILNFMDVPKEHGLPKDEIQKVMESGGWENLKFNQFGDEVLNYGRFNSDYEPSKSFSFIVAQKTQEQ